MATKKLSCKLNRKSWKCTVLLDIHTVTCRGVHLPKTGDIYLSVCIMGQCRKTSRLPPRFPLLFNQRLVFEKTYTNAVDPSAVADRLKADTTSFRLIQSVSPESKTLATMTQNSRDFLNPGPTLSTAEDSLLRDAFMMERSSRFHGAFPTVEFSVTSFIEASDWIDASPMTSRVRARPSSSSHDAGRSRPRRSPSPPPCRHVSCGAKRRPQKHRVCLEPGYQQPTVASTTRALSPYTHRKMCQLSLDAEQRLKHLRLGPHYFRKETESIPPFLVSTCSSPTDPPFPQSYVPCCHTVGLLDDEYDSLLDSYRPRMSRVRSDRAWSSPGPQLRRDELTPSPRRASSASPVSKRRGPATSKRSLRERLQTGDPSPSYWEQIHRRVQKILLTHRVPLDLD
ncbi:spermatogenesis-associated protein 6 isoform X2 [Syngnathoides biaculeatus]|uniref:spermatogenesis-associated protein 6 isoform X2 n=1 Tax=Syngnathoides biaculeatus TaxID=300417 RepID=UPI002ADE30BE|nr:spermatogenesis-associated protein 6 isoform X2 [Syngnathoides biaculeatus]